MSVLPFAGVVVGSALVSSFSDWLFMGVLFHERYKDAPEVWRPTADERGKIIVSQAVAVVSCAAFGGLCLFADATGLTRAIELALLAWVAGPAPLIAVNTVWIRMHPVIAASHAAGWLVRFLVTAGFVAWLL